MESNESQKFIVEVDGVTKEADVLKVVGIDGKRYVIYAVPKNEEESDILASEVVTDAEGYDTLVDIEDAETRKNVLALVNIMFS